MNRKKANFVAQLIAIRHRTENMLRELLPPCPECCPPSFPGDPGEIVDHGKGEIHMCEHCWGRGYVHPDVEEDDGEEKS
jgi:hypothetical protein